SCVSPCPPPWRCIITSIEVSTKILAREIRLSTRDEVQGKIEDSTTYVIASEGKDVGRIRVVRTERHVLIAGIQILPEHQNKGIGSGVIQSLLHEGRARHIPVTLEVEKDNPRGSISDWDSP